MPKFLLQRKLAFRHLDELKDECQNWDIDIFAVDHVCVESWTEQFIADEQTREDALFAFIVMDNSLELASLQLDSALDDFC